MSIRAAIASLLVAGVLFSHTTLAQQGAPSPWQRVTDGNARKLVVDSTGNFYLVRPIGVFKSTDQGFSWSQTSYNPTPDAGQNTSGAALYWNDRVFVGSASQGVWVSQDAGASWVNTFPVGAQTSSKEIQTNGSTVVMNYIGTLGGLYKYKPGTNDWTQTVSSSSEYWDFAVDSHGHFYTTLAVGVGGPQAGGMYKSTDAGENWTLVGSGTSGGNNPAYVECRNDTLVYVTRNGKTYRSVDLGATWTQQATLAGRATDLQCVGQSYLFASTSDSGVFYSTNHGQTWTRANAGLPTLNVSRLTEYHGNLFAASDSGLFLVPDLVVTPHALASYALDGNATDQSGSGNDGVVVGAAPTADRSGSAGSALLFNGTSDYVDLPESQSLTGTKSQISIEAWINAAQLTGGYIISSGNQNDFAVSVQADGRIRVELFGIDASSGGNLFSSSAITAGAWYHIAVTYDGQSEAIYINGILDTARTATGVVGNSPQAENVMIGAYNGGSVFAGAIDEVHIANYPIPATAFPLQLPPANVQDATSDVAISFTWDNGGGSAGLLYYKIYRGTDSTSMVCIDSTTATSYTDTTAIPGVTYYYRISAVDVSTFESAGSIVVSATLPPPAVPTTASPVDRAEMVPVNTVLSWNASAHSQAYDVEVSTDSLFGSIVFADSGLAGTIVQPGGLQYSTTYYWHVRGRNRSAVSAFSAFSRFTTFLAAPAQLAPADASGDHPLALELRWGSVNGAALYFVEVSTDSLFAVPPMVSDSLGVDTVKSVTGLAYGTRYFWRVRGGNAVGYGGSSPTWSFWTVVEPPSAASLVSPAAGALNVPVTSTLEWQAASRATWYQVLIARDSLFTNVVANDSALTDTSRQVGPLEHATEYFWRVRAGNAGGTSVYSEYRSFTTVPAPPAPPALVSPGDGAVDQSVTPTLQWNTTDRAAWYQVEVSRDSLFTDIVVNDSALTDTARSLASLQHKSTYYWHVRAGNVGGVSAFSAPSRFTTIVGVPGTPALVAPANGSTDQHASLAFVWNSVPDAVGFHFQLATDSTFSSGVIVDDSTVVDTTYVVNGLAYSSTFYWRVQPRNIAGPGPSSDTWHFATIVQAPTVPALVAPAHGASDVPVSLTLQWSPAERAAWYHLQVAEDSLFTTIVVNDSGFADTSRSVGPFVHKSIYYWHVRAGNVGGVSAFSIPSRFTTIVGIPGPPALIAPDDLAADQPLEITFRWNPAADAARYVLQVGRDSTFAADFVYADSSLTDTLQTVAAFAHSTRYFWRVGAANVSGNGNFSPTWRFTTGLAQTALAAPADGATDQPVTVALSWHPTPGAVAYLVQVSPDPTFSGGLTLDDQNVTDTTRSVSGLAHDVRYFWRVAANNASSNGPFSTVRAFRTIVAIPQTTQLASPADGEVLTSGSVSFSWHPGVPAVDRYALEFGNDSLFSASIADSTITDTSRTFAIPSGSGKYWWRVRAHNAAGWGPNSDARSFTLLMSSAQEEREIPKQFSLSQNYPNPFNPSTVIRYGLPTRSEVSLVVYNIIGQEVRQLVSETQEAGYHQYTFDATGLPSGFYFYRLHAGDFLSTKKLILLK